MTVEKLIESLKLEDPQAQVFVDWDREGGNESEVSRVEPYKEFGKHIGIALR